MERHGGSMEWFVERPGSTLGPLDHAGLLALVRAGEVRRDTLLRRADAPPGGMLFYARELHGLFSSRDRIVALLLLGVLGKLGADRFYLGLPLAGCGRLVVGLVTVVAWIAGTSAVGGTMTVVVGVLLAIVAFFGNVVWIIVDGVRVARGQQLDGDGQVV